MNTGIIFQIKGHKATVLKPDGSFLWVKAQKSWKVGEVVSLPARQKASPSRLARAFAACLALFLLAGFGWRQAYASPVALISLDVNPALELSINRFNRIVSSSALNKEGEEILSQVKIKDANYQDALSSILNAEGAKGYLSKDADVVLTVFSSNSKLQSALLSQLQGVVDSNLAHHPGSATAEYHAVDRNTVNRAHKNGVTAGKYIYLQQLQELAPETDISQYAHHSIQQIKGEIRSCEEGHGGEGGDGHAPGGNGPGGHGHGDRGAKQGAGR